MTIKVLEKFILLSILVFFAAFYLNTGLEASREEKVINSPRASLKEDLTGSVNVLDREASNPIVARNGNVIGATYTIDKKLSFFRLKSTPAPEVRAYAVLVGDITTGEIYHSANEKSLWPMASLSKLMSGVVVTDNLNTESTVSIHADDLINLDNRFVNVFTPDSQFSVDDLNKALLIASSNESAEALARQMGRSNFIKAMNDKAKEWGLSSTFYKDPAGISASNQSSALDIFKLSEFIYKKYPSLMETTSMSKAVITEKNSGKKSTIYSTHQFASRPEYIGGKTGTTPEAGENLLTVISYGGRPVAIIVLGTESRFEDTDKLIQWFKNDFSPGY